MKRDTQYDRSSLGSVLFTLPLALGLEWTGWVGPKGARPPGSRFLVETAAGLDQ